MNIANLSVRLSWALKNRFFLVMGVGLSSALSACTTAQCDSTGAMASHCAPVNVYTFTGESFEEDKMFYYRKEDAANASVRDIPATALSERVLKGQKDFHIVWFKDREAKKAIFYRRPASF